MSVIILIIVTMIQIPLEVSIVFLSAQQVDSRTALSKEGREKAFQREKLSFLAFHESETDETGNMEQTGANQQTQKV